jgi:hypothetical protein
MQSVFRLAARRTSLRERAPKPGAAPVSEKRIGLNRSPRCRDYGLWMQPDHPMERYRGLRRGDLAPSVGPTKPPGDRGRPGLAI